MLQSLIRDGEDKIPTQSTRSEKGREQLTTVFYYWTLRISHLRELQLHVAKAFFIQLENKARNSYATACKSILARSLGGVEALNFIRRV